MTGPRYDDKVWINNDRKLDGVCSDVLLAQNIGLNVLIVAHFPSSLGDVAATLRLRNIEFHNFLPFDRKALCERRGSGDPGKIWLAISSYFQADSFAADNKSDRAAFRTLIVEHHPLAARDQSLLNSINALGCLSEISFHSALTDPLLIHFGGEKLDGLLKRLGHDDRTCISHALINQAIVRAQDKIASQVGQEMQTQSAEDWFKYNLSR